MKTPPLLLGAMLLFWGWQTGYWVAAAVMAALLESSRLTRTRWEFSHGEFNQLWNLSVLLLVGAFVYAFASNEGASAIAGFFNANSFGERSRAMDKGARAVLVFMQWLPFVFFPFMLAQAYSLREKVEPSAFSLLHSRRKHQSPAVARTPLLASGVNVSYPYFGVCLASAGAVKTEAYWFYAGACLLLAWALFPERSPRFAWPWWVTLFLVATALGFVGFRGLLQLHKIAENIHTGWVSGFGKKGFDAGESRTAIGRIGKMKLSGRIMMRLEIPGKNPAPQLMRETTYTLFKSPTWFGTAKNFVPVYAESNESTWVLLRNQGATHSVRIATYLSGGKGLLALPLGAARLEELPVFQMETNRLGLVRVGLGPGLVMYRAQYGSGPTLDGPPDRDDLAVPADEAPTLAKIAEELGLPGQSRTQTIEAVARFFRQKFRYSTWLKIPAHSPTNQSPLTRFLLQTRAGHCEYFATATVLLLRQAGIQTRYAAGYSVQEVAGPRRFVVRERHAHAWCLYYDPATLAWRDFDTTPGTWLAAEENNASFLEPLADLWSRLWFEFSKIRWGQSTVRRYLVWVIAAAIFILAGRFFLKKRWRSARPQRQAPAVVPLRPGLDSEFYRIEQQLVGLGLERWPGETLAAWLTRIEKNLPPDRLDLRSLLALHYRHRFDPLGLPAPERAELRDGVQSWLAEGERH